MRRERGEGEGESEGVVGVAARARGACGEGPGALMIRRACSGGVASRPPLPSIIPTSRQNLIHCIDFICLSLASPADLPTLSEQYALKT